MNSHEQQHLNQNNNSMQQIASTTPPLSGNDESSSSSSSLMLSLQQKIFNNNDILPNILSYVGNYHYLYESTINHNFRNVYTTLYPTKETKFNGSTIEHVKLCYHESLSSKEKHNLLQNTAFHGNIEGLRYLQTQTNYEMSLHTTTMKSIVMNTFLNVLIWAREVNATVQWNDVIDIAAAYGNIILLEWLYTNYQSHFTTSTCAIAAFYGQLQTLQWLRTEEHKCPWDDETCSNAACKGKSTKFPILRIFRSNIWMACSGIIVSYTSHLEVLQWAFANHCPCDELRVCHHAAECGNLDILQWARSMGFSWSSWVCSYAAMNGHLMLLQWAHNEGCPWNEEVCNKAAENNHLEVLKYARANDCPWNYFVCILAAEKRNVEILQWAQDNGCPLEPPRFRWIL